MRLLERRLWPSLAYVLLLVLICATIWQMTMIPTISYQSSSTINTLRFPYILFSYNTTPYVYPINLLPTNDYNQLIDLNFTFNTLSLVCNDTTPLLLVTVHSAIENFQKRQVIRETWGASSAQVRVVFMVGQTDDSSYQALLAEECSTYNDLVVGNFLDTYRNITYKHTMLFKYIIYHCPHARYILKTDDDVFVHMPAMMVFLTEIMSPYGAARLLACTLRDQTRAPRSYRSKWRVSFKEYKGRRFPKYCPGWVLLYSPDIIFDLYIELQKANYFWIDDVHVTGVIARKAGVVHSDIENLVLTNELQDEVLAKNITHAVFLFARPEMQPKIIRQFWNYISNQPVPSSQVLRDYYLNNDL